jgi:hypothetical protein
MRDPSHPERQNLLDWLGQPFDPDLLDLDEINARLRRLK